MLCGIKGEETVQSMISEVNTIADILNHGYHMYVYLIVCII
jgi:hypothetical protein